MYKLRYHSQDYENHLRKDGKSIEMVYIDETREENVTFFCEEREDSLTMDDIMINENDDEFIYHMVDGKVQKTDGREWVDVYMPKHIMNDTFWRFGQRSSYTAKTGIEYYLDDNNSSMKSLKITMNGVSYKIYLGKTFSINCDTGVVMAIDYPRYEDDVDGTQTLSIFHVKDGSIKLVHKDIIKERGTLGPDVRKMKISKYNSEECWKITYQGKTVLKSYENKVKKLKGLRDLVLANTM